MGYENMKGIILAGGTGSRLYPLTKVTNKHLLPVYDKPMIFYPLQTLLDAGINEIMIVSGKGHVGHFLELLGSGSIGVYGLLMRYRIRPGVLPRLWGWLMMRVAVVLGDNIFQDDGSEAVQAFEVGGHIFLKKVEDDCRFGVAQIEGGGVVSIEEKPEEPKSDLAVTGLYLYDNGVFEIIRRLKPSGRGELEITDVNNEYIRLGEMSYSLLEGYWSDAWTFESLLRAGVMVERNMQDV